MKTIVLSVFLLTGGSVFAQEKVSNARNAAPQPVVETPAELPAPDSVTVHSTSRTGAPKTIAKPQAVPAEAAQPKAISPARKPD